MQPSIHELREQFLQDLAQVKTTHELEQVKVKFLGKKGPVQELMRLLKELPSDQRPIMGKEINDLKGFMALRCEMLETELVNQEQTQQLAAEALDVTLPGHRRFIGRKHPLTQAMDQMIETLLGMGFSVQYGPEIDTDYYNFEVLNFPAEHPARDMQDTFYLSPHVLLRTHTSNIQARVMEMSQPPIRIIAPGKVYRNEAITVRSHVFFHQVEAVYVDQEVSFAHLLATMDEFLEKLFKRGVDTRYRPSYFPFVEPGMEVDIKCLACQGQGCFVCKHTGWLEIAGAGMIHPQVLLNGGIDPEHYTGFAWGMGVERLVMLMRGVEDIRAFTENDLRFLNQFTAL